MSSIQGAKNPSIQDASFNPETSSHSKEQTITNTISKVAASAIARQAKTDSTKTVGEPSLEAKDSKKLKDIKGHITQVVPEGPLNWETNFIHPTILNEGGYKIGSHHVLLKDSQKPQKVTRDLGKPFSQEVASLKQQLTSLASPFKIVVKDQTTDRAIHEGDQDKGKIAVNFANAHHVGGGPGIYIQDGQIKWNQKRSAQAQEESLVNKSTLYRSLAMLLTCFKKIAGDNRIQKYYDEPINSIIEAYVSDDQLFGIQPGNEFYETQFLKKPRDVSFITSAATCHGRNSVVDCNIGSLVYLDVQNRIRTHLYASAVKALAMKQQDPNRPVELIVGAFGCGAFAPKNAEEYATVVANIYKEELPQFQGIFDEVTFAIPKLGRTSPIDPFVRNFDVFMKSLLGHVKQPVPKAPSLGVWGFMKSVVTSVWHTLVAKFASFFKA